VSFDDANLVEAQFHSGAIRDCTFRKSKMRKTNFEYVDIEGAVFEGLLDHCRFEARGMPGRPVGTPPMRRVDFSRVLFRDSFVMGYRLEDVRLPPDALLVRDLPRVIERAEEILLSAGDELAATQLDYDRRIAKPSTTTGWDYVYFPSDLASIGKEREGRAIGDAYVRAMAEVEAESPPRKERRLWRRRNDSDVG
jgi:hypothetical protein